MGLPAWLEGDERIVFHHHRPASAGRTTDWPQWLPDDVRAGIVARGIEQPWTHQVQVADHAFAGRHVAIATSTASGKTLGYLMPVMAATAAQEPVLGVPLEGLRSQLLGPRHAALYIAPTKALAHDQYRAARDLGPAGWKVGTLDGDSDQAERRFARDHAGYVLTNPDMLHHSVLPSHERWTRLLSSLRYVVVDEAHRYRGVFGAHVALVLRRLRRLCAQYGANPTFILASATTTDVSVSGARLIGEESIVVVDDDGSPRAARDVVLWQPRDGGTPAHEASDLMARLVGDGKQTITFVASRTMAELIAIKAQEQCTDAEIASYRAGYLATDRRELERRLQTGELGGVAATNALELGVDIAGMDAVVVTGFPGTLSALWQQVGRAGRRDRDALALVLAREDPLDAYLFSHPELIFDSPVEQTVLHPENPHVLGPHVAAAAQETYLTEADARWFGSGLVTLADHLAQQQVLRRRPQGWFWTRPDRAVDHIDLRSMGGRSLDIIDRDTGRVVGQVDPSAGDRTVHEGAVYLHQGEQWLVDEYAPEEHQALVHRAFPGYWTQPKAVDDVRVMRVSKQRPFGSSGVTLHVGDIELSSQVIAYLRRDEVTGEVWDQTALDLPVRSFRTRSLWWTVPNSVVTALGLNHIGLASALHAAEHTAIGLLPMFAPCDRWDIGGLSTVLHPDTDNATIFVHDGHAGGAGFAERGFNVAERWLTATLDRLQTCPCEAGCPACVVSPKCGNANQMLDKLEARRLVEAMLECCR